MEEEFIELINRYQGILQKICNIYFYQHPLREDYYQEILIRLWKAYPKFKQESTVSTWLYRVTLNAAIDLVRKESVQPVYKELSTQEYAIRDSHPEENTATDKNQLIEETQKLKTKVSKKYEMIGHSDALNHIRIMIDKVAVSDARVLITGPNGCGKELVAHQLHEKSHRNDRAFIEVNCAAIPSELIESELFGHEKGSFTSAIKQKKGKFELASGGTLFLDEIGDMSLEAQAKVLRALQENKISRIGSDTDIQIDVRVIAATNKNLRQMVADGQFREDLFYRLNVVEIYLPPLRKRKADIPDLIQQFLKEFNEKYNLSRSLDSHALETLVNYEWKGNVRELRHMIERLVVTVTGDLITTGHLPQNMTGSTDTGTAREVPKITDYHTRMQNFEEAMIREAYQKCGSSRKMAAYLNISQTKANRLIQKYLLGNGSKKDIAVHPAGAEDLLQ